MRLPQRYGKCRVCMNDDAFGLRGSTPEDNRVAPCHICGCSEFSAQTPGRSQGSERKEGQRAIEADNHPLCPLLKRVGRGPTSHRNLAGGNRRRISPALQLLTERQAAHPGDSCIHEEIEDSICYLICPTRCVSGPTSARGGIVSQRIHTTTMSCSTSESITMNCGFSTLHRS
jgi:hypothetical protein